MSKNILIHNDNVSFIDAFENEIKFKQNDSDIDRYISENIINELYNETYDVIFIKDNLTSNYLELLGLRVAFHIRLSMTIKEQNRYTPIVILSDADSYILNKLVSMANILFTKNIFIIPNTKDAYEKFDGKNIPPLSNQEYKREFLDKITIERPKDTSGSHDIANQWAIYRWAELLKVDNSEAINKNKKDIENQLYFKYLKALHKKQDAEIKEIVKPTKKGKVLLIDDEWDKGWNDVLKKALDTNDIEFSSLDTNYKDKEWSDGSYKVLSIHIKRFNPDVVILDLRLAQNDHKNNDIDSYTGIKILQKIHEINAGIQVIMLTATSKSTILEKLYEKNILGYIKKEHPDDTTIDSVDNINKFVRLIDNGLSKKYLKEIWTTQQNILDFKVFESSNQNIKKIYFEISNIFDISKSNLDKKTTFFVLSIYNVLELVIKQFDYSYGSAYSNIVEICHNLNVYDLDTQLSKIICTRNYLIHLDDNIRPMCTQNTIKRPTANDLVEWIKVVEKVLKSIN